MAHLCLSFSRLQVAPGFAFCCPGLRKAVPSCEHMILLALCWTPSRCFVFLRAVSVCKGPTDFSWELMSAGGKGIIVPLPPACTVVMCVTSVLQPHMCLQLTEARLPSLVVNCPPTSFPLLCWHWCCCSPMASQKQSRSSS